MDKYILFNSLVFIYSVRFKKQCACSFNAIYDKEHVHSLGTVKDVKLPRSEV